MGSRRPSFLISALVHVIVITLTIKIAARTVPPPVEVSPGAPAPKRTVFLPPAAELRRMLPATPRPVAPRPTPVPTPPPREARDRISVGAPSALRQERLLLERDKDLSSAPAASGRPGPVAPPSPAAEARSEPAAGDPRSAPTPSPAAGRGEAPLVAPRTGERSITSSLRNLEQRLGEMGGGGLSGAAGQQMGPLFFDPEGADFTAWINHFKNEVYRNWIVPQAALFGAVRGHVDFAFTVERDGTIAEVRLVKTSGTQALDRAAANALFGARLLALPAEFGPPRVTMQISFFYGAERS
jgi:periplasmic protein TonB